MNQPIAKHAYAATQQTRGTESGFTLIEATIAIFVTVVALDQDVTSGGIAYFDKIILAGRDDIEPEGTVTVVRADGTAETRRPDGTITQTNPFPADRVTYS